MAVLNKKMSGMPAGAVYIGRGSKWGNPFVLGRDGNRDSVCDQYYEYLCQKIESGEITKSDLLELIGKDLVCFCAPRRCHGHTLVRAVESVTE